MKRPPLRILLGPTASGKEMTALAAAERIGAEIVLVDSMKIYRGMDVGTASPTGQMRRRVRHWCVDLVDPWEAFSVAEYLRCAENALASIEAAGGSHILSGGTALYLKAITEGLFDGPGADPELRSMLDRIADAEGSEALHRRLCAADPAIAEKIHANDRKRIVRALEVIEKTGRRMSEMQEQFGRLREDRRVAMAGLFWDRETLHERISRRVDRMLAEGLVEEAKMLFEHSPPPAKQAAAAVGYRELYAHFRGECSLDEAVELIRRNTRRLAKSQMTWFRKFDCEWIEMREAETREATAVRVLEAWERTLGEG
jgi:tRNA dimethylallyltransferase